MLFSVVICCVYFFFFKQKTADEMRISDWSSDVCSSDLIRRQERLATIRAALDLEHQRLAVWATVLLIKQDRAKWTAVRPCAPGAARINAGPQARNGACKTVRAHRQRSDARRVGKGSVSTCGSRWWPYH